MAYVLLWQIYMPFLWNVLLHDRYYSVARPEDAWNMYICTLNNEQANTILAILCYGVSFGIKNIFLRWYSIYSDCRLFDHIHISGGVAKLRIIITNNTKINVKKIYIKVSLDK